MSARMHRTEHGERRRRDREAGGALIFVLIIMAAALFVAAMSLSIGLSGRKAAVNNLRGKEAFLCAETALERGRGIIAGNQGDVGSILSGTAVGWYPIAAPCPGAAEYTYRVTIEDNMDDANQAADADGMLLLHAETLFAGAIVASVTGIVDLSQTAVMQDYEHQAGLGARKAGNK